MPLSWWGDEVRERKREFMFYSFEPSKKKKILYFVFYVLYIIQMPFAMLFMIQHYKSLIRFLFRLKDTDFVFTKRIIHIEGVGTIFLSALLKEIKSPA